MVAFKNTVESRPADRVEVVGSVPGGGIRWRIVFEDRELWLDARLVAIGELPEPFSGLGFDMGRREVSDLRIDLDGVLFPARDFAIDEYAMSGLMELFSLVVLSKGGVGA